MPNKSKKKEQTRPLRPAQRQHRQPGLQARMRPLPDSGEHGPVVVGRKLEGLAAIVTGGDSGIGRAVALAFAREGADVAIAYLDEHEDAQETEDLVRAAGARVVSIAGDIGRHAVCRRIVERAHATFGRLDILVNNAAEQHPVKDFKDIDLRLVERTFRTNILSMFALTKEALPRMRRGSSIINTTSVTAYRGSPHLVDYSATKGAIVSFTRSLSSALASKGIRVNAVAPGPVWTPLIPATFEADKVRTFGSDVPLARAAEPVEVAPAYVFLASREAAYITGQVIHVNGGEIVNG